jgi:hypothetical protein
MAITASSAATTRPDTTQRQVQLPPVRVRATDGDKRRVRAENGLWVGPSGVMGLAQELAMTTETLVIAGCHQAVLGEPRRGPRTERAPSATGRA